MSERKFFLGLDLGSVSLVGTITDEQGNILWTNYHRVQGRTEQAIYKISKEIAEDIAPKFGIHRFDGALVCGSGKEIVGSLLDIPVENEIVAHGTAAARAAGGKRASVIEIGGQDSKFILVDEHGPYDYSMNELCAAGTGAFLDVQAERLGLEISEFSRLAAEADNIPPVAGRCSVFAKSDIIHLQQRGATVSEIVAGLCFALARNYIATLIRGREIIKPVVFQGGVALNKGVVRAFRELLHLDESDVILPEMPHIMGAFGSALLASKNGKPIAIETLKELGSRVSEQEDGKSVELAGWDEDEASSPLEEFELLREISPNERFFLGIDIGSVSTDAALIDEQGELVAHVYTFTAGKPLKAVEKALRFIGRHVSKEQISGVATTGSGRKLVGFFVGADVIIDEITAQAKGAFTSVPEADTVIEIGGQDAKFIRLDEFGLVEDFEMNRACSAGTGSFLQEQAVRLGVNLKTDFAKLALSAEEPIQLASRCTVFMESDLVHHIQQGAKIPELLMGIAGAVVGNYLDRVAMGKKIGNKVVIQGGVAKNAAVVEAFRKRLKDSEVMVHPNPGLSGAIGAAQLAAEEMRHLNAPSKFKGFSLATDFKLSTFICHQCENQCEVKVFKTSGGKFFFGDLCGRYGDALQSGNEVKTDYTEQREDLLRHTVNKNSQPNVSEQTIGIPEALMFREYYPFWAAFFTELGVPTITSGPSDAKKLHEGLSNIPAETCLPVKLMFGHVAELKKKGIRKVFIPASDTAHDGRPCPYEQHSAAMISSVFRDIEVLSFPLIPGLSGKRKDLLIEEVKEALNLEATAVEQAYEMAEESYRLYRHLIEAKLPDDEQIAVIIGKPYNAGDRFMNLSLSSKLAKSGFSAVMLDQLIDVDEVEIPEEYNHIRWTFSRRMLRAALIAAQNANMFPVIVTNFGCGPDSFTIPLIEEILQEKPFLVLEIDEHRADAGMETRIEAFAQRVKAWKRRIQQRKIEQEGSPQSKPQSMPIPADVSTEDAEYIIPYFSEHAYAFAAAIRADGFKARVLPPPDEESYDIGQEITGGKPCHPFQLIAGDIIKLLRKDDLPHGSTYLFPVVGGSCLITQYDSTIQKYLHDMGRDDVRVLGGTGEKFRDEFGIKFLFNMWRGILGIEYLLRLRYELRPYEVEKGSTDAAYKIARDVMLKRLQNYRAIQGITEAVFIMQQVQTENRGTKPVIGIAGDVYTRVNPAANGNLFDMLEELGCEVWLSPTIMDVSLTGTEMEVEKYWREGRFGDAAYSWFKSLIENFDLWQVQKHFKNVLHNLVEPEGTLVNEYIKDILPKRSDLLVELNVAKHMDFVEKGVDGILNVFCLNCMVGTSTTAVFPVLKEKSGGLPIMSLVFDGFGTTHVRNRLEAFVHRVKRFKAEKEKQNAKAA